MDQENRNHLIRMGWDIHAAVEESYRNHPAIKHGAQPSADWLEKQRLLLADMAIHLLQTAIKPGDIDLDSLKNNLHAILTISDQFLPSAELKKATDQLFTDDQSKH